MHPWRHLVGWGLLGTLVVLAVAGPWVLSSMGLDPVRQNLQHSLMPPGGQHMLGTDVYGRDVMSRLLHGLQLSMALASMAACMAAVPGVLMGLIAAWWGGRLDRALAVLGDAILSVPGLLLVLLLATVAPGSPWALTLGLAVALWVEFFRVSRAVCRPILAGDAVQASRLLGFGATYVLRRHVWPAVSPILGTLWVFSMAQAVLALAALGFISVGLRPPTPELGLMMIEALPHYEEAPWLVAAPVGALMWLIMGMMLLVRQEPAA